MKTIDYKLKSNKDYKGIPIDEETSRKAGEFVDFVLQTKNAGTLVLKVMEFDCLVNPSIAMNAVTLVDEKYSEKLDENKKLCLQDKLYLETCLFIHGFNANEKEVPAFLVPILDGLKEVYGK